MVTEAQQARLDTEAFGNKVFAEFTHSMGTMLVVLGDRLGLYKALAGRGPVTSEELASLTGLDGRYVQEWLNGMVACGYLEYLPDDRRYLLPEEWVPVLADEGGPAFMGAVLSMAPHILGVIDEVETSFRTGGGVHQSHYNHRLWGEMQRQSASLFNHMLVPVIIPAIPGGVEKLERGARVVDLGSGGGRALIRLAQAFPASTFVGYDVLPAQVELATRSARAAGVSDRVEFRVRDVQDGLDTQFDIITSFDVVHDAAHPGPFLKAIRQALAPDGAYAMLEPAAGESLEDNIGPIGTFLYGSSVFYCMTTALAVGGEGTGTAGLPPSRVRGLASGAGFGNVEHIDIPHPIYTMYVLTP
jgi:SAM-dependent methyltransferase